MISLNGILDFNLKFGQNNIKTYGIEMKRREAFILNPFPGSSLKISNQIMLND